MNYFIKILLLISIIAGLASCTSQNSTTNNSNKIDLKSLGYEYHIDEDVRIKTRDGATISAMMVTKKMNRTLSQ